ncbi:MAG: hypothetical protein Tsb0013_21240 [Phycisphaerales bacterium]
MEHTGLHKRMASVVGEASYAAIAAKTRTTPATARRYLLGHAPSVEFLQALCDAHHVNAHWLLTGQGPMYSRDLKHHALRHANPTELMSAIARALESLTDRLDRLETFVQTQEARLRARGLMKEGAPDERTATDEGAGPAGPAGTRAGRIAQVVTKRPPSDADRAAPPRDA